MTPGWSWRRTIVLLLLASVAAGCGESEGAEPESGNASTATTAPSTTGSVTATAPLEVDSVPDGSVSEAPEGFAEPAYEAGDVHPGLDPYVEIATQDLAERLDVDPSTIGLHASVVVIWPDAALGCPEPGVEYAQVLTDGAVIELEIDGRYYRYHAGGARQPFLCDLPLDPVPESIGAGGDAST